MRKDTINGMYFIDDDFRIVYYNDAVKSMYPEIEVGQFCYSLLASRNNPCSHCPLLNAGKQSSFYNSVRHEWIHAQTADAELPTFGKCHSVMFTRSPERTSHDVPEELDKKRIAYEYFDDSIRTGMIGGYCEDGFPIYFANDEMVAMLGYDNYEDFCSGIGGMVANTIHPDDMAQVVEDIGPEYYVGLEYETVYRMPRKDGSWFWTVDKGRVVEAEDGRLAIVSFCTDMTGILHNQQDLEMQNETLQKQNRLMEYINEGMPGGYHRCSTEEGYPFIYVSRKFLNMLGFTRDELRELFEDKFINLIHPDDLLLIEDVVHRAQAANELEFNCRYRIRTKTGYMQVMDNTRISEFNDTRFFQGVIIDISKEEDMKEHIRSLEVVQQALQEALVREKEFRQELNTMQNEILGSISCGVFAYTLPEHKLLTVNTAAKKIIGCGDNDDPVEVMKRFVLERVMPEDRDEVAGAKDRLTHFGASYSLDYRAIVDEKKVYIHSNIKYLCSSDGKPYVLITLLDTTEQAELTNTLAKERKTYRDALDNGSEFSFLLDINEGIIHDEFITAHGVNLIKAMGFTAPVGYDELLAKYCEVCELEFGSEEMKRNFTCQGLIDAYNSGKTNIVTEYYNADRDLFFRVNCLVSLDDETGHLTASIVADDVTDIRKQEKAQRKALKAANEEMNLRIDAILDGISGGLKIIDIENGYRYEYISEGAARLQGYTVEEFMERFGGRVTSNIYGDEGEPALAEANRQMAMKGSYSVKYRVAHRDGTIKWVIDRGKYIEDPNTGMKCWYILMQDVTDLEERNEKLSDFSIMQQQMADSLGSGIFAYTLPEYDVLLLNQEARRMFDCIGTDESTYGIDIIKKVVPEDMEVLRDAVKNLNKPGDEAEYVFHSIVRNNERRSFKSITKLLSFLNGQKYIISAITDITNQELTEKRLEEERSQYRKALAYSSDSIFTVDLTDGMLREDVFSKDGYDLLAPLKVKAPISYNALANAWFANNRIISDSEMLDAAKSRERLIENYENGNSIIDIEYHIPENGKYYRVIILLYMINDHLKANFILSDITSDRHEEKQRRSVIDSIGSIYLALYHISFTENTCTMMKAHSDILADVEQIGSYDDFYRVYIEKYTMPEFRESVGSFLRPENIRSALASTDFTSIELKRLNLGWCRITLVAAERDEDGVVTSVVFAGNVIEAQKQAELAQQEALMAACESANIANSAKTDFLANMSHDIRTPMNAIIGMTAIAGTHLDDRERVADCLSKISISSKHLLGIINEVLDMSKIESGKMELQEGEFNLPELIDNLLTMSKPEVNAKNHELNVNIRNIEHEHVIGDSQRIQQVFMNLMSNAIKYTPYGGKLSLYISEKSTNRPQIGCYEFIFEDNGIGMSEDFIAHIFEPFSRAAGDPRINKIQGTGLGMPITKNIIQMMNGDIKVESELDKGTRITVTIFLKIRGDSERDAYEQFIDLPILVADDDPDSCVYTCDLLGEIGMSGEWVLTGREAIEKAVQRHNSGDDYFAVILDWKMPDMDGVQTTREIRRCLGKDIPIIIISAYDWSDIELEARAAGADAFISKPLFKSRMVHLFNELVDSTDDEKPSDGLDTLKEAELNGKRALLVEDNSLNAEIAGEILTMAGLEVEFAVNGKEAVDIMASVEDGYFDVIFMDIQMPIMNGYEAARAIRALPRSYTKSVPILAMTANAFAEDVEAAKNAGMNEHIAKPIDFDQLGKVLKKWLN